MRPRSETMRSGAQEAAVHTAETHPRRSPRITTRILDTQLVHNIYMSSLRCISFVYKRSQMTESSRIYWALKQDIVTCTLKPGLSISEQEMCLRYQASRTPIREACRKLCGESLMQMIPFRGYSIPPLTFEEYRNLNEL